MITPIANDPHDATWSERLQDWQDGDLPKAQHAEFQGHLAVCEICQAQLALFQQLDSTLATALPRATLDASFDTRLLAQIYTIDASARTLARQRLEQEMRENLQALSRRWRRGLAFVVPGVIAGTALAVAVAGWFDGSGLHHAWVSSGIAQFGDDAANHLQILFTATIGGGIGWIAARWLSGATD